MRYEVVAYLAGPLSLWSGKPHPREIIARRSSRWRWHAQALAQSVLAHVDSGRCGYVIMKGGEVIHHQRAKDEQCNPLSSEELHIDIDVRGTPKEWIKDLSEILRKSDEELEARIREHLRP